MRSQFELVTVLTFCSSHWTCLLWGECLGIRTCNQFYHVSWAQGASCTSALRPSVCWLRFLWVFSLMRIGIVYVRECVLELASERHSCACGERACRLCGPRLPSDMRKSSLCSCMLVVSWCYMLSCVVVFVQFACVCS